MSDDPTPAQLRIAERRSALLESAFATFAAHGYRRTSMDDVAQRASISRPGLYLHFPTKRDLLRAAVEHALNRDLDAAVQAFSDTARPFDQRIVDGLTAWAGRYVGPFTADLDALLEQDPTLLGDLAQTYSARFDELLIRALADHQHVEQSGDLAILREVIMALVTGLKRRAADTEQFRSSLAFGLERMLR